MNTDFLTQKRHQCHFFVISFKVQGQICKIIPISSVYYLFSSLAHLIILLLLFLTCLLPLLSLTVQYRWRRRSHSGCHGILEKRRGMVVEIRVKDKVVVMVVLRTILTMAEGGEIGEAWWW